MSLNLDELERLATKFASRTERAASGCLEWTGAIDSNGYGSIRFRGRIQKTHRVAFEMANGLIPAGLMICHHCDNRKCVEPSHLFAGTAKDNAKDCAAKGRLFLQTHPEVARRIRRVQFGENATCRKLTEAQVVDIRRQRRLGVPVYRIAESLNVGIVTVQEAANGKTWSHVKEPIVSGRLVNNGRAGRG